VIDASIATWNNAGTSACSYLKIVSDGRSALDVGNDNINLIKFRDTVCGWPAAGNDPPRMYPPSAAGFTTMLYVDDGSVRDGAILDADIEINGVNFAISVNGVTRGSSACPVELQNNLTHELGHLVGLEHTCLAAGDPARMDNLGNPVPACGVTIDPRIVEATMYNFQDCRETKKETLSDDDIQAVCDMYPIVRNPRTCNHAGGGGPVLGDDFFGGDSPGAAGGGGCCDTSAGARPDANMILAGATIALLMRRRRPART